ncbi:MAG: hypothetical protein GU362_06230 [Thaumarchaeota archaeon]|jgi:hypothetical protein|nr:hypothetical protein [Nitrososphaerota archaeon]
MNKGLALAGIGILALIILSAGIIAFIANPASFLALETQAGQEAYKLTGGLVGVPPPPKPPVSFNVGEEVLFNGNTHYITGNDTGAWGTLGVGWNATQPMGSGVFTWYGSCKAFTELYALNVTNNANVPIVKIVIYLPQGRDTPAPLPAPWTTNETHYSQAWQGNATSFEIAYVNIPPHSTVIVWNASTIGQGLPIWFYFSNGSAYETQIPWTPNYPL